MLDPDKKPFEAWWRTLEVPETDPISSRIGPFIFRLKRRPGEWILIHRYGADAWDSSVELQHADQFDIESQSNTHIRRIVTPCESSKISFVPMLADRSVVTRPEDPLIVAPRHHVILYVTSPLWIRFDFGGSHVELPCWRPSDTWFGSSTMSGELCYASRTAGRFNIDDVPLRPHRAVTAVKIDNRTDENFNVERILLPVKHLAIHADRHNRLWTDGVTYARTSSYAAAFEFQNVGQPPHGGETYVSAPRDPIAQRTVVRALTSLFG